jgi:hypothetical protein
VTNLFSKVESRAAGFVDEPKKFLYSSAIDYSGGKGLLDIIFIN